MGQYLLYTTSCLVRESVLVPGLGMRLDLSVYGGDEDHCDISDRIVNE